MNIYRNHRLKSFLRESGRTAVKRTQQDDSRNRATAAYVCRETFYENAITLNMFSPRNSATSVKIPYLNLDGKLNVSAVLSSHGVLSKSPPFEIILSLCCRFTCGSCSRSNADGFSFFYGCAFIVQQPMARRDPSELGSYQFRTKP